MTEYIFKISADDVGVDIEAPAPSFLFNLFGRAWMTTPPKA